MKKIPGFYLLILVLGTNLLAQYANLDWKIHGLGNVRQFITNMGTLDDSKGHYFTTYNGEIWSEMPPTTNEEHILQAGIWIGAITPQGDTLVSVTSAHFTPSEFFPTPEVWDTIWVVRKNQLVNIPYWPNYEGYADEDLVCRYDDYHVLAITNHQPLYLDVIQRSHAWSNGPLSQCIILDYDILPLQFNLSQVFFAFWLHGEVGDNSTIYNSVDENIHIFPEKQMIVDVDAPGGEDGTAFSPIGIKILEPQDTSLNWTMAYYDHEQMGGWYHDPIRYRAMIADSIYPNRLTPEMAHVVISFGPFQSVNVGDTLHIKLAEVFGNGLNGVLANSDYLDSVSVPVIKPDLWMISLKKLQFAPDSIKFEYSFGNFGTATANLEGPTATDSDNVAIRIFYSEDSIFNNGNDILALEQIIGPSPLALLNPGEIYTSNFTIAYPANLMQTPFVTMMVDCDSIIDEFFENNNSISTLLNYGLKITYPQESKEYFVLPDTTSSWAGIKLKFKPNFENTNKSVEYAWAVDNGDWHWIPDTILYIPPQEFAQPLIGEHDLRVTWGENQQIIGLLGDSVSVNLIEPGFYNSRLVVDETDETLFTGSMIQYDDAIIDSFYMNVFRSGHTWDITSQGMVPKSVLGNYKLIIWHSDNLYLNPPIRQYSLHSEDIADYLNIGGDIILSGHRILNSFNPANSFPQMYEQGNFIRDYFKIETADETILVPTDFVWAAGLSGFSDIHVDSLKLTDFPYFGKLGGITLFLDNDPEADLMFTYQNDPSSLFLQYRGLPCGIKYNSESFQSVLVGFPLFFIKQNEAEILGEELLLNLGYDPTFIEQTQTVPLKFEIQQNYPNPFNSQTVIEFCLPSSSHLVIKIFDILGRELNTIVSKNYTAGKHRIVWDGKDRSGHPAGSGIYFYLIKTNDHVEYRKMMIVR